VRTGPHLGWPEHARARERDRQKQGVAHPLQDRPERRESTRRYQTWWCCCSEDAADAAAPVAAARGRRRSRGHRRPDPQPPDVSFQRGPLFPLEPFSDDLFCLSPIAASPNGTSCSRANLPSWLNNSLTSSSHKRLIYSSIIARSSFCRFFIW
jgi:hypothetical protein